MNKKPRIQISEGNPQSGSMNKAFIAETFITTASQKGIYNNNSET